MQTLIKYVRARGLVDLRAAVHVVMLHPPSITEGVRASSVTSKSFLEINKACTPQDCSLPQKPTHLMSMLPNAEMRKKYGAEKRFTHAKLQMRAQRYKLSFVKNG